MHLEMSEEVYLIEYSDKTPITSITTNVLVIQVRINQAIGSPLNGSLLV